METNPLEIKDVKKLRKITFALFKDYSNKQGVFEQFSFPPEYNLPKGMQKGSDEQLLFLTLTVSLDYMRDAVKLWKQSYDAWLNLKNRWIFNPKTVVENGLEALVELFKSINEQRPQKDAKIWFTICKKLLEFDGSVYKLLEYLNFDAMDISVYLDKNKEDFPYLRGYKIKSLWLRMVNDTAGIKLKKIEDIPVPIDVHTARMTLRIFFNEDFNGEITKELREKTQKAWKIVLSGTSIYPLQIDEPLWLLGKYRLLDRFMKEHNFNS